VPTYISPLDDNYIALKRAAALIARERSDIEADDFMEAMKHALFMGELELKETAVDRAPAEDWDAPLLPIEAPPVKWPLAPRLPIDKSPQQHFAVRAPTIAFVLGERNALPGGPDRWTAFTAAPARDADTVEDVLGALAHIPWAAYPPEAKAILGDIVVSKEKLRAWMVFKGYALPAFLRNAVDRAGQGTVAPAKASPAKSLNGRHRRQDTSDDGDDHD